eukprot:756140-Hanusia_phi.AAC.5
MIAKRAGPLLVSKVALGMVQEAAADCLEVGGVVGAVAAVRGEVSRGVYRYVVKVGGVRTGQVELGLVREVGDDGGVGRAREGRGLP